MFRSYRDTIRTPVKTSKESAKKYYCDLCDEDSQDKYWESESDVEIHRRGVHKEELIQLLKEPENYMCSICLRKQTDRASLISHIKTDHLLSSPDAQRVKRELFICDYCNNLFFNKLLLIAHIKFFHSFPHFKKKTETTTCPFCLKIIKVRCIWFHFLCHGIIHTGTCPICLIPFDDYQDALKHTETHPGHYYCTICTYETDKEGLFLSHIGKHKQLVNLEGKDVSKVTKYFVSHNKVSSWNKKVVNIFKGITLAPEINICVVCTMLCETEEQMLHHIYGDHSPMNTVTIRRHLCACGEEFFNRVLLKHHIFKLKGHHRVSDGTETTIINPESNNQDPVISLYQTRTTMPHNEDKETAFYVEITENENTTDPITLSDTPNDITHPSLEYISPQMTKDPIDVSKQIQDIPNPTNLKSDYQLLKDLNDPQEVNSFQKVTHIQTNSHMDTHDYDIQTRTDNNLKEIDLDDPNRLIIDSDNDIYNDQIILNANSLQQRTKAGDMNVDKCNITDTSDNTFQLVQEDQPLNKIPKLVKKPSHQNVILLNETLQKKYASSKQFYKQIVHINDVSASESSKQYRYVLDPAQGKMEFIDEASPDEEVYEVVEMPGERNDETGKIIVEEALLFS